MEVMLSGDVTLPYLRIFLLRSKIIALTFWPSLHLYTGPMMHIIGCHGGSSKAERAHVHHK